MRWTGSRGTMTHNVENSLFPNRIGDPQMRFFELSPDRLTLATSPMLFGGENVRDVLSCERA